MLLQHTKKLINKVFFLQFYHFPLIRVVVVVVVVVVVGIVGVVGDVGVVIVDDSIIVANIILVVSIIWLSSILIRFQRPVTSNCYNIRMHKNSYMAR